MYDCVIYVINFGFHSLYFTVIHFYKIKWVVGLTLSIITGSEKEMSLFKVAFLLAIVVPFFCSFLFHYLVVFLCFFPKGNSIYIHF
jgi:hypothetical protein